MTNRIFFWLITSCLLVSFGVPSWAQKNTNNCDELYQWVVFGDENNEKLLGVKLYQPELLISFYTQNNCQPVWSEEKGAFRKAEVMMAVLDKAEDVVNYHVPAIDERYTEIQTFFLPLGVFQYGDLDKLDVLLTDAALHYSFRLQAGEELDAKSKEELGNKVIRELQAAIKNDNLQDYYINAKAGTLAPPPATVPPPAAEPAIMETLREEKQQVVVDAGIFESVEVLNEQSRILGTPIFRSGDVGTFYNQRGYKAAWHDGKRTSSKGRELIKNLERAGEDGLESADYHLAIIKEQVQLAKNSGSAALNKLDIVMTDAALHYAYHLAYGKLNPKQFGHSWNVDEERVPLGGSLNEALENDKLTTFYNQVKPQHQQYKKLQRELVDYQKRIAKGTWEKVPEVKKLELGMVDDRVVALRKRLEYDRKLPKPLNDVRPNPADSTGMKMDSFFNAKVYDRGVRDAVIAFQKDHGLAADGVVGKNTIAALNVPLDGRVNQIKLNMERWRWLPNDLGTDYLLVNVPSFELNVYEDFDSLVLLKKVQVGKTKHKTPIFNDLMQYLEFNPYWTVPFSIATKEILPKLKRNAGYLTRNNMELLSGGRAINPYGINWANVSRKNFHYTIRQKPGAKNALGRVKFMFPNLYNVYLHDTPSKSLFARSERTFSHGCVRLEKPFELAEYLLKDEPKWSGEKVEKLIERGKNKRVYLTNPRPIYILYFTTWVGDDEKLRFYKDVYGRDEVEKNALLN